MRKILGLPISILLFLGCSLFEEEIVPFTLSAEYSNGDNIAVIAPKETEVIFNKDFPFSGTIEGINSVEIEIGQVSNNKGYGGDSVLIDLYMEHAGDTIVIAEDYIVTAGEKYTFKSSEVDGYSFNDFNGNSLKEYLKVYVTNNNLISNVGIKSIKIKGDTKE